MKRLSFSLLLTFLTGSAFANVLVSSPQAGQTVTSNASFVASATTSTCSRGIASMGVYVDNQLQYVANGASLSATLPLTPGKHSAAIQEWDFCGGSTSTQVPVTVVNMAGVWVASPANNSTVSSIANYVATATTSCSTGVAAMGVYVNDQLTRVVNGAKLNTQINLAEGSHKTVIQEWDNCGGTSSTPLNVYVKANSNTFSNIQASKGWYSWGQKYPDYSDCDYPCSGVTWSMAQGVTSPSLSGNATQVNLGGTTPYSDVLYANHLIGPFSSQGLSDEAHVILPTLHNFTYDTYFYVASAKDTQALEFDINWFANTVGITWGTECRIQGGNEWDIWDNVNAVWVPTGVACNVIEGGWNHVTINAQRGPDNAVVYQSITLNGITSNINKSYPPFTVPADWYGVTVNYQMDGNAKQASVTSYFDKLNLMYW